MDKLQQMFELRLTRGNQAIPEDPDCRKEFPTLFAGFTTTDLPNNFVKEPWTVSVRAGVGEWIATLRDDSLKMTLSASSASLGGIWKALEVALTSPTPAWSAMRGKDPVVRKRRDPRG